MFLRWLTLTVIITVRDKVVIYFDGDDTCTWVFSINKSQPICVMIVDNEPVLAIELIVIINGQRQMFRFPKWEFPKVIY